mmetsp:Transcript_35088/g.69238  ORF Transcript_35088/g.69238 Transcript_35088/m.69238 type:complete len:132 (+) Transcript_35088:144-539(+)
MKAAHLVANEGPDKKKKKKKKCRRARRFSRTAWSRLQLEKDLKAARKGEDYERCADAAVIKAASQSRNQSTHPEQDASFHTEDFALIAETVKRRKSETAEHIDVKSPDAQQIYGLWSRHEAWEWMEKEEGD